MRLCHPTQAQIKDMLRYENGKLYWRKKVSRKINVGDEAGTLRKTDGYSQIMINRQVYRTHRLVYLYHFGYTPETLDHINQNPSDNRIENLRPATRAENAYNSKLRSDNISGVKGVTWDKAKKKWGETALNGSWLVIAMTPSKTYSNSMINCIPCITTSRGRHIPN